MIGKIKRIAVALGCAIAIVGGGGVGLNSCTLEPSVESPSERRANLPKGMPPELAVYGPVITSDGSTRVIRYTVEVGTTAPLEYTPEDDGAFTDGKIPKTLALSVEALMLQYGTQATNLPASAAVTTSLFNKEIPTVTAGGSVALKNATFVIIPLETDVIKKQLSVVLPAINSNPQPLMWIENNTGETMPNTWGAGTYAQNGIRIGGFWVPAGSSSSTVADFDDGDADKNHPSSLATVLYTGKTSTINFYNPVSINATAIMDIESGSLQATSGQQVKNWLENKTTPPTPPAVSVIYKWK
jgi:hypothetical protein